MFRLNLWFGGLHVSLNWYGYGACECGDIYSRSGVDRFAASQGDSRGFQRSLGSAKKGGTLADSGAEAPDLGSVANIPVWRPRQGLVAACNGHSLDTTFLIGEQHCTVNV
jgi:hypothetical protein